MKKVTCIYLYYLMNKLKKLKKLNQIIIYILMIIKKKLKINIELKNYLGR